MAERINSRVTTGKVRFSYAHLFAPRAMEEGQAEKYSLTILIPKQDVKTKQAIDNAINAVKSASTATWGGSVPKMLATPVYDGDGARPNGEEFGVECRGHWVLTASSINQPGIVDININPILNQSEVYSGCYGRVSINFFAYNKAGKKGIGCGLNNVQKLADGEPLGGKTLPEKDFADEFAEDLLG